MEAEGLTRRFGEVTALDAVSLSIRRGEFFSLLGPSGCGKTTLLRLIAGLDLPDAGRLRIGGADALELPTHRRPVNTVFQSYALFPHLDVWNNVAFGLRMKRVPQDQLRTRVQQSLELVQIPDLAKRRPAQLSGGQRQRVALARAIVNEPAVLLLDEPLGALDLQLRRQLQVELRALQRRLGMTFVHVTHDQDEALTMSDRVAVMEAGRIVQLGEPAELYDRPRTRFVARFLGECNLIEGTRSKAVDPAASAVDARTDARMARGWSVDTALGRLQVVNGAWDANGSARRAVSLAIRPERLRLMSEESDPGLNRVSATIRDAVFSGPETQYVLEVGGTTLRARLMNHGAEASAHRVGESVTVELPADALVCLDD